MRGTTSAAVTKYYSIEAVILVKKMTATHRVCIAALAIGVLAAGCYPQPGPDKTVGGAVLGAGWGAGLGAVAGNQVANAGPGAAVGAGLGAVSGMLTGGALDIAEGSELQAQRELDSIKIHVAANQRRLELLQSTLDSRDYNLSRTAETLSKVFFDTDRASLRSGAAKELQVLAERIKNNPYVGRLELHGHSDDTGSPERDTSLSESRTRTVATFLANQGISLDQMELFAHGSRRPLGSNESEAGRQLNRRVEIILMK